MVCFPCSDYAWRVSFMELAQPHVSIMQSIRSAVLLLGLSGAIGLMASPPAQAGPNPPLVNCVNGTLDTFLGGGCSRGDKNFIFSSGSYSGNLPADQVNVAISGSGNSYTINISPDSFWSGAGFLTYTIEVNNRSTDLLASLSGGMQTSEPGSTFTGNTTATNTNPGTCGSSSPVTSWSCAGSPLTYPFGVITSNVNNSWDAIGLNAISNTIRQQPVPGPLPLFGAGMAFGFSRKLRKRLKACT